MSYTKGFHCQQISFFSLDENQKILNSDSLLILQQNDIHNKELDAVTECPYEEEMGSFRKSGSFLPNAFVNLSADSRPAEEGTQSPIKDFKPDTCVPQMQEQLKLKLCAVEEDEESVEPASEDKSPQSV